MWQIALVCGVFFTMLGLQFSCTKDDHFNQNIEIIVQIPLPDNNNLKSGTAVAGIQSVVLTVSADNKILTSQELTINGNQASGIISVLPGKNRKFTAQAIDGNGIVQYQGITTMDITGDFTVGIELASLPPATNNLQGVQVGKSVNLSWNQNTDPDFARYDLFRSQSDTALGTVIHSSAVISEIVFTDSTVAEGKTYYFRLTVSDTEGLNTKSNPVRIEIPFIHPRESVLKVDSINRNVFLSWTKNTDNDFARYDLYRSQSKNLLGTVIHSSPSVTDTIYKDSKVTEGQSYYYRLAVLDKDGFVTRGDSVVVTIPLLPPEASILRGNFIRNKIVLSWSKNTESDFARYDLYRSQSENLIGTVIYTSPSPIDTTFDDNQIEEGGNYYYRIAVIDKDGRNTRSEFLNIKVPATPPVASILYGAEDGSIYLSWTKNTDSDFAKYELYKSENNLVLGTRIDSTSDINNLYFEDSNVIEGKTYHYTLKVFDKAGNSTESNKVTIKMQIYPPTKSELYGGNEGVYAYLYWYQNYDSDFAKYELYRSESENSVGTVVYSTADNNKTDFEDYPLQEGKTYYYTLIVFDKAGYSTKSDVLMIHIPGAPPIASTLSGSFNGQTCNIALTWTQNYDSDFTRYELYRSTIKDDWGTIINTSTKQTNLSFTDTDKNICYHLSESGTYYYRLFVYDTEGNYSISNTIEISAF